MHWMTFVLLVLAILVAGFVAVLRIATNLEIQAKRNAAITAALEQYTKIKEEVEKTTKVTPKKKAGRPSKKVK